MADPVYGGDTPAESAKEPKDRDEVFRTGRRRYELAVDAERENEDEALGDLKFYAGEQWPSALQQKRREQSRPCMTINRLPQFVRQVTGDIRQNKPAIKVRPHGGGADKQVAEVMTGLIRNIEEQSSATGVYIAAAESAARCGIGHWRIATEYSSDDAFDQDIRIRRIANPFAVKWDPHAQEPDKSDAEWCFVAVKLPLDEFKARYPDAAADDFEVHHPSTMDGAGDSLDEVWWDGESVTVVEYWLKRRTARKIALYEGGRIDEYDGARPDGAIRTREVAGREVVCYVLNGAEILAGPKPWAGRDIPIVSTRGEEIFVGERTVRRGLIRDAKDSQRLFNFMRSAEAETIALQPKAPWVGEAQQFEPYKALWERALTENLPYLPYAAVAGAPPPTRLAPPEFPIAMSQAANEAAQDMHATTGIYPPSLGQPSNEKSGKAIIARQREGDVGSYLYVDNLSAAIAWTGKQLIDLIPRIYDTERVFRVLNEDETEDFVTLNRVVTRKDGTQGPATVLVDKRTGREIFKPPLDAGEYDVAVQAGPSYSTRRAEAADSMMQFVQAVPSAAAAAGDLIARAMDWPGADKIAERLKKTLPPGLAEPEPEDAEREPTPIEKARMAEKEAGMALAKMKYDAEMAKAEADKMQAEADKAKATAQFAEAERTRATGGAGEPANAMSPDQAAIEARKLVVESRRIEADELECANRLAEARLKAEQMTISRGMEHAEKMTDAAASEALATAVGKMIEAVGGGASGDGGWGGSIAVIGPRGKTGAY